MSDNSRLAALDALEKCRRSAAWTTEAIDTAIKKRELDARSAALASHIFLGVMQNLSLCDFYIDAFSKSDIEPKVRDILRCAVYQVIFMDRIPDSAAVNEAVKLTKSTSFSRASGFVNAVLRKIVSQKDHLPEIPGKPSAEYLSVRYSHPLWLVRRIIDEKGYDFAEFYFAANNAVPDLALQVNTLKTSLEALRESGFDFVPHTKLENCILPQNLRGSIAETKEFSKGLFYVQDPAARCAVSVMGLRPGFKVLDACAAPGGKSFAAAIEMKNNGSILSCDIHEKKLKRIEDGAKRLGIDIISTRCADARSLDCVGFDAVICDVPCSGLGVIRKKPDIRFKSMESIAALPEIQLDILRNVSSAVKPGGVLMYSTCTVLRAENEDVIAAFLKENTNFSAEAFELPFGSAPHGYYTFWPNVDNSDGFFICKLRRVK